MHYRKTLSLLMILVALVLMGEALAQTVDDFNRATLGANWTADPEYRIVNNTMDNSSTVSSWEFLAVYNAVVNPSEVQFTWAATCDAEGANSGGVAIYLSAPSVTSNGYFVMRRYSSIDLHPVVNGVVDRATTISNATPTRATPAPGTIIKVVPTTDANGHHFDFYVNGQFDGRVSDTAKRYGNGTTLYAGVCMYGNRANSYIDDFTVKSSSTSSITVTSPNGGENWTANSVQNITWTSASFTGDVKIEFSTDAGVTYPTVVAASTPNTGTFAWTVPQPATLPQNNCRIRIGNAAGGQPVDISNANFIISQPAVPKVVKPNGGEIWIANTQQSITWSGYNTPNVRIRYKIRPADPWTDITASTANTGSFNWTVPAQFTTEAKIKVSDPAEVSQTDESDNYFTITALAKLSVNDASGQPGTTGNVVNVWLNNQVDVRGVNFVITDTPNTLTATNVIPQGRAATFTTIFKETGNYVQVVMVHMSGQVIPQGNDPIAQIIYNTSGDPSLVGSSSAMAVSNVTIYDKDSNLISPQLVPGNFYFVEMGNVNGTGGVTDTDLAVMRDLVMKRRAATAYEKLSGDIDHDGDIDLYDYLGVFNILY